MKALTPLYAFIYLGIIFAKMIPTCKAFNHGQARKFGIVHPQMRRVHVSKISGVPLNAWQEMSRDPHFLLELPNLSYLCSSMQLMQRANGGKPSSSYHLWSNRGIPTARLQSMVAAMDMLCRKITALPLDHATSGLQENKSRQMTNPTTTKRTTTETPTDFIIFKGGRNGCPGRHSKIQTSTMKTRFTTKPELNVATTIEYKTPYDEIKGNEKENLSVGNMQERNSSEQSQIREQRRNKSQSEKNSSFDGDELKPKNSWNVTSNNETEIVKLKISLYTTPTMTESTIKNQNTQSVVKSKPTEDMFYEEETISPFERETTELPTIFDTTESTSTADTTEPQATTGTNEPTTNMDSTDPTITSKTHDFKGKLHTSESVTSGEASVFTTTEETTKYTKTRETTHPRRIFESSVTNSERSAISEDGPPYYVSLDTVLKAMSVSELIPEASLTTIDQQSSTVPNSSIFKPNSVSTTESNTSGNASPKLVKDTNSTTTGKEEMSSETEEFDKVFNQDLTPRTKLITKSQMQMEPKPEPLRINGNLYQTTKAPNARKSLYKQFGQTGRHQSQNQGIILEMSSTTPVATKSHETSESVMNISPDQETIKYTKLGGITHPIFDTSVTTKSTRSTIFEHTATYNVTPDMIFKADTVTELIPKKSQTTINQKSSGDSNSNAEPIFKVSLVPTTEANSLGFLRTPIRNTSIATTTGKEIMSSMTEKYNVLNQDLTPKTKLITKSQIQMEPEPLRIIPVSKNGNPYHVTQPPNETQSIPEELGQTERHPSQNQEIDSEVSNPTQEAIESHQTSESAMNISPDQEVQQQTHRPELKSRSTDRGDTSVPKSSLEFQMSPAKGMSLPSGNIVKLRAKNGEIKESKWDAMNKYALTQLLNALGVKSPKIKFKKRLEVESTQNSRI